MLSKKLFSSAKLSGATRSAISVFAITAVVAITGACSPLFVSVASANNGLTVSAVPNTGMLTPGQSLEVRVSDPSGTTDAVSDSCTVNNVDVNSTFHNAGPGDYRYTYTVSSSDQNRFAGQIPLNCTIHQTVPITFTGFDDNNTVGVQATAQNPLAFEVSAVPNTGTLTAGQQLQVYLKETSFGSDQVLIDGACRVNDQDVSGTFQNLTDGLYKLIYTVGASDNDRAAGQVPIDCSVKDPEANLTSHIQAFNDGNQVAVHALGNGTGTTTTSTTTTAVAPSMSMASVSPHSGMLVAGNTLSASFTEAHSQSDLTLSGACTINSRDVSSSWHSVGGGQYVASYTVQSGDDERAAGTVPVNCMMSNSTGTTTVSSWMDGNSVAIDTNGNGSIDAATSSPINFTSVSIAPSTGTLGLGDQATLSLQDGTNDGTLVADFCRVNDVDVTPSMLYMGNGLYHMTYTVASGNAARPAGYIPLDCTMHNASDSAHVSAWTDGNSTAIDPTASSTATTTPGAPNGGGNGGTGTTTTSTSTLSFTVGAVPSTGTIAEGSSLEVYFDEASHDSQVALNGACTVNNVDVASTFQNLTDGLYRVIYHVGLNDTPRPAGTIPVSCSLKDNSANMTAQLNAFTDNNTVAVSINGTTGTTTTSTSTGTIGGGVTGGTSTTTNNGVLHVDSISQTRDTATAGGGWDQGWAWTYHVTVPMNETSLSMKFADWTHSNGTDHLATANNMRIWSNQAATTTKTMITSAGTYSDAMTMTGDLDPNTPGRQVDVMVEMQVPSNTLNGSYTTDYGVKSI